ncbi:deoxyribodipyrimidine photo-lyase [Bosea caraganae]|uniref:Deoxyribodipyrimidine photo-lyase n=1 Tax=Bosea caraganae TaxID=2763117 RepID=A0A370L192_9HYPH|nr:deoxyribodipyrimidine photo-lyase [Bosea caraganae]RDJ21269.1 deoxyribodipyrimidine photo-lyase [Bosea caraganae]RDJ26409.1 deoxyribodipyrimidine photo-lyase [Bosea caraganae]
MSASSLVWFRDDLRLADNSALAAAASRGPVFCLYIHDEGPERRPLGGAARWWLSRSLAALAKSLTDKGGALVLMQGDPARILPEVVAACGIDIVSWNRRYDGAAVALDTALKANLLAAGVKVESHNANLLNEPWEIATTSGTPMKVFTPYWRAARAKGEPATPGPAPERIDALPLPPQLKKRALPLEALALEPTAPDWAGGLREAWMPGEAGARQALAEFLDGPIRGYGEERDRPDKAATSRLSPHLRFGELSPRQIWHAAQAAAHAHPALQGDVDKFLSEIGWREFSYHLLFHNPGLATANYNRRFDRFPWRNDSAALRAWRRGQTGYPIIDASMRELWTTGWMHNRVRMVVASFLIKHLLIDWREGEAWFWDTLVDADPANNPASWQWVAGSGADAAPYFRIFNPVTQGEKFDPKGSYVRRWVPEIAGLGDKSIHQPWKARPAELAATNIRLGETYPEPIIALDLGRRRALDALATLGGN